MASPSEGGCNGGLVGDDKAMDFYECLPHWLSDNLGNNWCRGFHEEPIDADNGPSHDIAHSCVGRNGIFVPWGKSV